MTWAHSGGPDGLWTHHRVALRDRLVHGVALKSASHPDPGGLTRRRRPARRPVVAESHGRQLRRRGGGRLPGPRAGLKMGLMGYVDGERDGKTPLMHQTKIPFMHQDNFRIFSCSKSTIRAPNLGEGQMF